MEANNNKDLAQKLKELNALLAGHIQKTKKDVKQLEEILHSRRLYAAKVFASPVPGVHQLVRQWHENLN